MCKTNEGGGLDIKMFNETLIRKWKWWVMKEKNGLWKKIIKSKYGDWRELSKA